MIIRGECTTIALPRIFIKNKKTDIADAVLIEYVRNFESCCMQTTLVRIR